MQAKRTLSTIAVALGFGFALAGCSTPETKSPTEVADEQAPTQALGEVHFETSCNEEAQAEFNRAVALLHSFWFREGVEAFQGVLELDDSCGMAHWGIALSQWGNFLGGPREQETLARGWEATQRASETGAGTER